VHRKRETFFKETIIVILLFDDSSFSSVSITVKEDNNKEEHPSTGKTIKNDFNGEKDWIRGVV
jgi:hypothetical protein